MTGMHQWHTALKKGKDRRLFLSRTNIMIAVVSVCLRDFLPIFELFGGRYFSRRLHLGRSVELVFDRSKSHDFAGLQ